MIETANLLKSNHFMGGGDISITKEQNTGQISNQVLHFEQKILFSILTIKEGSRQKKRQRSSLLFVGRIYSIPRSSSRFAYRMILKNMMNSSFSFRSSMCNSSFYSKSS